MALSSRPHFENPNNHVSIINGGDKKDPNVNDKQEVKKADDQKIKNVKDEERKNVKDQQVSEQTINETADTITSLQSLESFPIVSEVHGIHSPTGNEENMIDAGTTVGPTQAGNTLGMSSYANVTVWVKLHGIPVTVFSEDGLSDITSKLEECPKNIGAGETKNLQKTRHNYLKEFPVGRREFKPIKQVYQPFSKKPTANTSKNKKKNMEPTKEVSKSNPFEVLTSVENDVELGTNGGTSNLASQETNSSGSSFWNGKPWEKVVSSGDYNCEDKVASVDNEMASFLTKKYGHGTQSLLEQWKESYENDDYEYDLYDDDMYEG
ncbi:hypothetical protein Tco_0149685 [Tanacetum coccineum]